FPCPGPRKSPKLNQGWRLLAGVDRKAWSRHESVVVSMTKSQRVLFTMSVHDNCWMEVSNPLRHRPMQNRMRSAAAGLEHYNRVPLAPEINDRPLRVLDPAGSKAAEQPRLHRVQQRGRLAKH